MPFHLGGAQARVSGGPFGRRWLACIALCALGLLGAGAEATATAEAEGAQFAADPQGLLVTDVDLGAEEGHHSTDRPPPRVAAGARQSLGEDEEETIREGMQEELREGHTTGVWQAWWGTMKPVVERATAKLPEFGFDDFTTDFEAHAPLFTGAHNI